jgi:hypothetical protein
VIILGKTKLTLSIDEDILNSAKKIADEKHTSISGLVERFLDFYGDPWVYCFKCGEKFSSSVSELCPKCGWMKCPECGVCRCDLVDDIAIPVFHMRRVFEDLVIGKVKND